jgi:hypothetical protein
MIPLNFCRVCGSVSSPGQHPRVRRPRLVPSPCKDRNLPAHGRGMGQLRKGGPEFDKSRIKHQEIGIFAVQSGIVAMACRQQVTRGNKRPLRNSRGLPLCMLHPGGMSSLATMTASAPAFRAGQMRAKSFARRGMLRGLGMRHAAGCNRISELNDKVQMQEFVQVDYAAAAERTKTREPA